VKNTGTVTGAATTGAATTGAATTGAATTGAATTGAATTGAATTGAATTGAATTGAATTGAAFGDALASGCDFGEAFFGAGGGEAFFGAGGELNTFLTAFLIEINNLLPLSVSVSGNIMSYIGSIEISSPFNAVLGTSTTAILDTSDAERRHNRKHEDTRICKKQLYNNSIKYLYVVKGNKHFIS
jgi:uncharacterized protein YjbI with pentapeptide repeats